MFKKSQNTLQEYFTNKSVFLKKFLWENSWCSINMGCTKENVMMIVSFVALKFPMTIRSSTAVEKVCAKNVTKRVLKIGFVLSADKNN
jgi:hypothetical protein